jgi:hypothetical protein
MTDTVTRKLRPDTTKIGAEVLVVTSGPDSHFIALKEISKK